MMAATPSATASAAAGQSRDVMEEASVTRVPGSYPESSIVSPVSSADTMSTESIQTVRGDDGLKSPSIVLRTPSFPFPAIGVDSGTPLATPPTHLPFTALSPTVTPNLQGLTSSTLAKGRITEDFKAPGRALPPASNTAEVPLPDPYELAIKLQTEPGLVGWWRQTSQILKESFYATRATLAIPSDKTEIENVPWAQLAEFYVNDDDDDVSRTTAEAGSTRSSLSGSFLNEPAPGEQAQEHESLADLMTTTNRSRPKLETRHSYAGYPRRSTLTGAPLWVPRRPRPSRAESQASIVGSTLDSQKLRDLGRSRPGYGEGLMSPMSEDTTTSSLHSGRILETPRPLEADIEPLITSVGVSRVLNNSSATVLTRKYNVPDESQEVSPTSQRLPSRGSQTQLYPRSKEPKTNTKTSKRTRSSTGSTARNSAVSESDSRSDDVRSPYEDFEQVPGTPWAQSPAPSPAAIPETEDNPFFSSASIQQSFRKHPPNQQYTSGQHFEAIGVDPSHSIIQLPLIHPSALLSQPQRLHRFRVEKGKERKKDRNGRTGEIRQTSSERKRKVPLAILSIQAPITPFPQQLVQLLNSLSPLLATSFYAASQHSNLQKEVSGLAQERNRALGRLPLQTPRSDSQGSEMFSPTSPNSAEPLGAYLNAQVADVAGNRSAQDADRSKVRTPAPRSPMVYSSRDGYFATSPHEQTHQQSASVSRHASVKSTTSHSTSQKKPHLTLLSQGADTHKSHQFLQAASSQSEESQSESDAGPRTITQPSSSMLRSMIDIGATQHLIAEPDSGRLLWVNSKFQAYRNSSTGQKLDDQLWNNIYPKDRKNFRREWLHALETGEQLSQQVRIERFDGQFRWFHIKFLPLKNELGVIKYWSGQAMDIHDLHEAEVKAAKSKEKLASEARYRAIANSLPVIVFAASVPSGMTFANTQWLSYSGQSLEQALGFGFLDHVHPDDLNKCRFPGFGNTTSAPSPSKLYPLFNIQRNTLHRHDSATSSAGESDTTAITEKTIKPVDTSISEETNNLPIPNELLKGLAKDGIILCAQDGQGNLSITTEMRLKAKDNEYRWHLVQGSYIQSVNFGQGDAQWFIACTDISAQKKNEAKIQEANSALENVNAALEQEMQRKMDYLSSMSHEIRTPLNSIIGNLQFLVQSGLEESALEWAHGAKEAATGMHELINDILDLSKAEAKMLKLQPHWFNPRDLGEQVMDILNPKAAGKKVEICQETSPEVPNNIRGDSGRIKQVLLNLVTNAIKFTNEGEVVVRCELQKDVPAELDLPPLKDNESFVRWSVTDTGIGFTQVDKKLLFKAYSQIKNKATRDTMGTGLGLILCKTMVNLHGGAIDATSVPGKGSTFSFFARFRFRSDSNQIGHPVSAISSPAITGPIPIKSEPAPQIIQSPGSLRDSPVLLSDSSSALSVPSSVYQRSLRSSISTTDSIRLESPLKLSLPFEDGSISNDGQPPSTKSSADASTPATRPQLQSRQIVSLDFAKADSLSPLSTPVIAQAHNSNAVFGASTALKGVQGASVGETEHTDPDRASFRPPMLSILVICTANETRRITCDRIANVVPGSAPCNIASEGTFRSAYKLLFGEEPVLFTHVVIRTVSNDHALECIEKLLASPTHSKACIVILTDQDQFVAIQRGLPKVDFDALNKEDRVKKVLKPAHPSKLAKIFDPFNENRITSGDPKETKRKAGERRTKEDFKLFKTALGGKDIRVLAVEDDKMQMNVLNSFLSKVCGLITTKAVNGQESLNTYLQKGPGYFSVIVSDTEMPVMNGLVMCRRIREEESKRGWPPINIVSLSANVLMKGWTEASDAGFSHYCSKPVSFSDLGRLLIELTDPTKPHIFLRDRPKPKALLKALGELDEDEDDEDDDEDDSIRP